jgi:hypothetical protein
MRHDRIFKSIDDDEARRLLEEILYLRSAANDDPTDGRYPAAAESSLRQLAEGVGGWAVARCAGTVPRDEFAKLNAELKRVSIARHLDEPLMQPGAAAELHYALFALNAGQVNDLLSPTVTKLRRSRPYDASKLELTMLAWLRWKKGRGHHIGRAEEELAEAIGRTAKSFEQWRRKLKGVFGTNYVQRTLCDAEAAGRLFRFPLPKIKHRCGIIDGKASLAIWPLELRTRPGLARINVKFSGATPERFAAEYRTMRDGAKRT